MQTFNVKIRISVSGATQTLKIAADSRWAAQQIAEMQYGKANVMMVW